MEESRGEGVLDRSVVSQQHRVPRIFGPAQCIAQIHAHCLTDPRM